MTHHSKVQLLTNEEVGERIHNLYELHDEYGKDTSFEFKTYQKVFVIFEENKIVAFATLCQPYGTCWLRNAIVDKRYRGRGFQKLLIKARVDYAKSKGIKTVTTAVDQMNVWSLNNLIDLGFRFVPGGKFHNGHLYQKLQIKL